ncbi:MAG: GTP-binding protein [Anaerolineaceae bacterium]|nr:GTP-binding protein [Anaerolineaceae bacterium]
MKLHLVGGFLGSGKTTAIIAAVRLLMAQGKKVGVVTNDQGKYLVDTSFFRLSNVPSVEVTGGCFCCNYDDLASRLNQLRNEIHPDVIFAESVGSCGDLVATVVKPLIELSSKDVQPSSFSVFTDSRLLQMRMQGEELPFSENVVYLFDKQIEEAGILVINKSDLLESTEGEKLLAVARQRYPDKQVVLQNSTSLDQVQNWVSMIEEDQIVLPDQSLDMDYERYGDGEAQLAWLDEKIDLVVPDGQGGEVVRHLIEMIQNELNRLNAPIGHVKFIIQGDGVESKVSITTLQVLDFQKNIPDFPGVHLELLINARVQIIAEELKDLIGRLMTLCCAEMGAEWQEIAVNYFHPAFPSPTHRL